MAEKDCVGKIMGVGVGSCPSAPWICQCKSLPRFGINDAPLKELGGGGQQQIGSIRVAVQIKIICSSQFMDGPLFIGSGGYMDRSIFGKNGMVTLTDPGEVAAPPPSHIFPGTTVFRHSSFPRSTYILDPPPWKSWICLWVKKNLMCQTYNDWKHVKQKNRNSTPPPSTNKQWCFPF